MKMSTFELTRINAAHYDGRAMNEIDGVELPKRMRGFTFRGPDETTIRIWGWKGFCAQTISNSLGNFYGVKIWGLCIYVRWNWSFKRRTD